MSQKDISYNVWMDIRNWARSTFERLKEKKNLIFTSTFAGLTIFRVWLILGVPKMYLFKPHDDLFFAKAAHYIIHGEWMGPYTQMTLIKTPFYAFFLVTSALTGLPLLLAETLYYVAACFILYAALAPLIRSRSWRLLINAVILYIPANLAYLQVRRDGVYFSTTLYVVAFAIGLFLRLDQRISKLLLWSIGLGLSMGAFMITREEGIWIYPVLFLFLFACLWLIWKEGDRRQRAALVLLPIILWHIPSAIVSYLNYSHYGFWGASEQLEPEFRRVIDTLGRIKSDTWHPLISISDDAKAKAYEVSPLFAGLKDSFDELQGSWNTTENLGIDSKPDWFLEYYGNGKSALSNDYFVWMMRDVMYREGYYSEGIYPKDFYSRLADELESACGNGDLECATSQKIPLIGSIDRGHFPIIRRMFFENILHLVNQDVYGMYSLDVKVWRSYPEGNDTYKYFKEIAYNPVDEDVDAAWEMLLVKEEIMMVIYNIYKGITPFLFATGGIAWVYLWFSKPRFQWAAIPLFLIGLFVTRLATLTIIDAMTGAPGIYYGESIYIFMYIFSILAIYWAVQTMTITRQ